MATIQGRSCSREPPSWLAGRRHQEEGVVAEGGRDRGRSARKGEPGGLRRPQQCAGAGGASQVEGIVEIGKGRVPGHFQRLVGVDRALGVHDQMRVCRRHCVRDMGPRWAEEPSNVQR